MATNSHMPTKRAPMSLLCVALSDRCVSSMSSRNKFSFLLTQGFALVFRVQTARCVWFSRTVPSATIEAAYLSRHMSTNFRPRTLHTQRLLSSVLSSYWVPGNGDLRALLPKPFPDRLFLRRSILSEPLVHICCLLEQPTAVRLNHADLA